MPNKSLQADNLCGVCIVVSLPLNFTIMQTPHKLRLSEALYIPADAGASAGLDIISLYGV